MANLHWTILGFTSSKLGCSRSCNVGKITFASQLAESLTWGSDWVDVEASSDEDGLVDIILTVPGGWFMVFEAVWDAVAILESTIFMQLQHLTLSMQYELAINNFHILNSYMLNPVTIHIPNMCPAVFHHFHLPSSRILPNEKFQCLWNRGSI